ncbi:MAG: riboflavin synthase [Gammaproteobacteria bacterium]
MFTGIITAIGGIAKITPCGGGIRLRVNAPAAWLRGAQIGGSIAVDGACLTAVEVGADFFAADVSGESLRCCAPWRENGAVNLEHPLAAGGALGGHFVSGHVGGIARLVRVSETGDGGKKMAFAPPPELLKYIVRKCSVAVAGVSLTAAEEGAGEFSVYAVPHTLAATTLGGWAAGTEANLETDILAAHLEKLARFSAAGGVV